MPWWVYIARMLRRLRVHLADTYLRIDPRSLGLFRIVFGCVLLADLYWRSRGLDTWYTNAGLFPNHTLLWAPPTPRMFSFFFMLSSRTEAQLGMALCGAVFLAFTLGWHTKLFHGLSFVCLVSLDSRIIPLENGGDVVLNLLCVWTLFLPLGRRFSLDALRTSLAARREHSAPELAERAAMHRADEPVTSLAVLAIILQLFVIYLFNVLHKTGPTWSNATAVHLTLHQDRIVTVLGVWLRENLPLEGFRALAYATLVVELLGAVLVISPLWPRSTRLAAILVMPALHVGFALCLDLGPFSYAMMSFFPLLAHRTHWDALSRWAARRRPARVAWFDAGCGICFQSARLFARLDRSSRVELRPNYASELPEDLDPALADATILVRDPESERVFTRSRAIAELVRALPFGMLPWLVLRIPGLSLLWDRLYDAVARNRAQLSTAFGYAACGLAPSPAFDARSETAPVPARVWLSRTARLLSEAACALVLVALYGELVHANAAVPKFLHFRRPEPLRVIVEYPRLFQGWRMFAPDAPPEDFNLGIDAWTVDGRIVDPYNEVASRHAEAPVKSIPAALCQDQFFTSYSLFIHRPNYRPYWGALEQWILRYHERTGNPKDRIVRFTAYKLSDKSPPFGRHEPTHFQKEPFLNYPKR